MSSAAHDTTSATRRDWLTWAALSPLLGLIPAAPRRAAGQWAPLGEQVFRWEVPPGWHASQRRLYFAGGWWQIEQIPGSAALSDRPQEVGVDRDGALRIVPTGASGASLFTALPGPRPGLALWLAGLPALPGAVETRLSLHTPELEPVLSLTWVGGSGQGTLAGQTRPLGQAAAEQQIALQWRRRSLVLSFSRPGDQPEERWVAPLRPQSGTWWLRLGCHLVGPELTLPTPGLTARAAWPLAEE